MYKSLFSDYEQYLTRRGVQNISAFHLTLQSFEKFCAVIIQDITADNKEIETFEEDRSEKSFRNYYSFGRSGLGTSDPSIVSG